MRSSLVQSSVRIAVHGPTVEGLKVESTAYGQAVPPMSHGCEGNHAGKTGSTRMCSRAIGLRGWEMEGARERRTRPLTSLRT